MGSSVGSVGSSVSSVGSSVGSVGSSVGTSVAVWDPVSQCGIQCRSVDPVSADSYKSTLSLSYILVCSYNREMVQHQSQGDVGTCAKDLLWFNVCINAQSVHRDHAYPCAGLTPGLQLIWMCVVSFYIYILYYMV